MNGPALAGLLIAIAGLLLSIKVSRPAGLPTDIFAALSNTGLLWAHWASRRLDPSTPHLGLWSRIGLAAAVLTTSLLVGVLLFGFLLRLGTWPPGASDGAQMSAAGRVLFNYFVAVAATIGLTEFWLCVLLPVAHGLTPAQAADERRCFWQSVAGRVGSLIVFTLGTGILYMVVTRADWDKAFLASGGFLAAILAYAVSLAVDITIDEERKRAHAAQTIPTQA